jgi:hypothetical protein
VDLAGAIADLARAATWGLSPLLLF